MRWHRSIENWSSAQAKARRSNLPWNNGRKKNRYSIRYLRIFVARNVNRWSRGKLKGEIKLDEASRVSRLKLLNLGKTSGRWVFRERGCATRSKSFGEAETSLQLFAIRWLLAIHPVKCTRKHRARIGRIIIRARTADGSAPVHPRSLIFRVTSIHTYSRHQMRFTPITQRVIAIAFRSTFYVATI